MPTVNDYLEGVYGITDRPDQETLTIQALNRALHQAHFSSWFNFDTEVGTIASPGAQQFSVALPARYRKYHSIVNTDLDARPFRVHEITPQGLFDKKVFMEKRNCFYVAGTNLQFRIVDSFSSLQFIYFKTPSFTDSKIASDFTHVIEQLAAAKVYSALGEKEQGNYYERLGLASVGELVQSFFML